SWTYELKEGKETRVNSLLGEKLKEDRAPQYEVGGIHSYAAFDGFGP
ncbi:hypothetical protein B9479_008354, partial [Cryptococcus floricola]